MNILDFWRDYIQGEFKFDKPPPLVNERRPHHLTNVTTVEVAVGIDLFGVEVQDKGGYDRQKYFFYALELVQGFQVKCSMNS